MVKKAFLGAAAGVLLLNAAPRAAAEPGRYDALAALIGALPESNPKADPAFMDEFGFGLPEQLAACRWKPSEMDGIDTILAVFKKHATGDGYDKKGLIEDLGRLPAFANRASDREARSNYSQLVMGIRLAADFTHGSLVTTSCRTLLGMQYGNGATRAVLKGILVQGKSAIDSAPAPR